MELGGHADLRGLVFGGGKKHVGLSYVYRTIRLNYYFILDGFDCLVKKRI
jgi:hypothetical protein